MYYLRWFLWIKAFCETEYLFCFSTTITFFLYVRGQTLILTATVYTNCIFYTLYSDDPAIQSFDLSHYNADEPWSNLHITRTRLQRHSGLDCLEIGSRNEEAINTTRNMIYSLKIFYFLLYRRRYFLSCFWIDVVCVLATTKNISAVAAYTRVIC